MRQIAPGQPERREGLEPARELPAYQPGDSLVADAIVTAVALGFCYLVGALLQAVMRFLTLE